MNITAFKNKQLLILSIALGLIFFGFNGVEQHLTAFYQSIGLKNLAFQVLALLYAAIIVGNFIGPATVRKLGIKLSLILGCATYVAWVFGIVLKVPFLVYFFSFLLGVGAGVVGIAGVDFLRLTSPVKNRGEYAGAIGSVRTFGGFLGILSVSLILKWFNIDQTFILLGSIMMVGVGLLFLLDQLKTNEPLVPETQNYQLMVRLVASPKILLLLPYTISAGFLLGLVLGAIPAIIERNFGIGWVGVITSIFHLTLALVLLAAGYLSDIKGRFGLIYSSMVASIVAAVVFLNFLNPLALVVVMILLGLGGSLGQGAFTALMLDTFEEKIKEASSILGNLGIILGIVPSFLLSQILTQNQLLWSGVSITLLGIVCVALFQIKYSPRKL